jgi:benzoyl-CoA-dihydrodiol lyase
MSIADDRQIRFETHPSRYKHLRLEIDGAVARVLLDVQENEGLKEGYELKLNSYDLSVDIELADVVQRLRFEHPEVSCVVVSSALEGAFCAGANIFMLGSSTHGFKVNFCKFTNETRLYIEDACEHSGQTWVAALNGVASGGGYELPLACQEIYLVDDRKSSVALPEVPYLGVLPGTGGITRVTDKRKIRKDRADVFLTLAEGVKGKRAKQWGLVDEVFPLSRFTEMVSERARAIATEAGDRSDRKPVELGPLDPTEHEDGVTWRHVSLQLDEPNRTATLEIRLPEDLPNIGDEPTDLGADWWPLRAFRELDDALLRLRFHHPGIGLVLVQTRGRIADIQALDRELLAHREHWFVNEVLHHMKRVLKRMDVTSKSFFALIDQNSCFAGSLFELALAADRAYIFDTEGVAVALSEMNFGPLSMGNGMTRLETRFLAEPERVQQLREGAGEVLDGPDSEDQGLVLAAYDDIDWEDEIRLAVEERASLSPDALTGMESNNRFAGPETLESKIFGRLSAWQNWIFQRPNAVGDKGALKLYGRPESPEFDWNRT